MSQSFFDWQRAARKQTRMLYAVFALVILFIAVVFAAVGTLVQNKSVDTLFPLSLFFELVLITLPVTALIILGGMFYRVHTLSQGGSSAVARMIGAVELPEVPTTYLEKRYLNVVEEVALAAGIPVPKIYILENEGVNAFAAGYALNDSLVCVTRGCLKTMPRDELEAIIGHEVGHIVHGDTRINLRAIGIIFGVSLFSQLGLELMDSRDGRAVVAGIALYVIGYVGGLASQVVQALLSRTREFHADASSVQFTRNPQGLANALKRIGGSSNTAVPHAFASEMRHMFFCEAAKNLSERVFSTHPPLEHRITKIEPSWDQQFLAPEFQEDSLLPHAQEEANRTLASDGNISAERLEEVGAAAFALLQFSGRDIERALKQVGAPSDRHLQYARNLMFALPIQLTAKIHSSEQAPMVMLALLLDADPDQQLLQLQVIKAKYPTGSSVSLQAYEEIGQSKIKDRLSIFDLLVPALRRLTQEEFKQLIEVTQSLIKVDKKVSLFEWCLLSLLKSLYKVIFIAPKPKSFNLDDSIKRSSEAVSTLLFALCSVSGMSSAKREEVFAKQAFKLNISEQYPKISLDMKSLDQSLLKCNRLALSDKEALLDACVSIVEYDQVASAQETQVLRAVASLLGCPMPPILQETAISPPLRR